MPYDMPSRTRYLAAAALLALVTGGARAQFAVSQQPVLTTQPPTNISVMIDDTGSMQWAYVPDGMSSNIGTRRFNAASFNSLAYNPSITYLAPQIVTSAGLQPAVQYPFKAAPLDGFNPGLGTVDLSSPKYQPTASYQPGSTSQQYSPPPAGDTSLIAQAGPGAYYTVYNTGSPTCPTPPDPNNDGCYQYVGVGASEQQNFANWYSYYRTRHMMIASAAALSMSDTGLQQARVTWRALNTCTDMTGGNDCTGWDGTTVDNRIRTFDLKQQANFYQWLQHVPANNSTPMRVTWTDIGNYFSSTTLGGNSPYGVNPNPWTGTAPNAEIACVHSYNITLTDGQWNESGTFFGTSDRTSTVLPANPPQPTNPLQYTAPSSTWPYTYVYGNDSNSDMLADVAFHFWSYNLRPDLAGSSTAVMPYWQVKTGPKGTLATADYWDPRNDPATWPHLVQMTIGIGMTSTMTASGLPWWGNNVATQYSAPGYLNLLNGVDPWPPLSTDATLAKAYDLWHAAINSRGLAFSAESPADLIAALKAALNRAKVPMSAQTPVAVNTSSLNNNTVLYTASYQSSDWHGTLSALGFTNGVLNSTANWTTDGTSPFGSRSIITSGPANPLNPYAVPAPTPQPPMLANSGLQFSDNSPFDAVWSLVPNANLANLAWLRGDQKQEAQNGGIYRNRYTSVLGDIVDSAPVFAWHDDFGFASLPEGMSAKPNYQTFLTTKAATAGSVYTNQGMLYIGANDGMLHGFDAGSGNEVFAYVPHDVLWSLPALSDPAYAHQFYVDQTPYVGDACVGSGPSSCSWATVLVGATGAGGQSVFAIDVTQPASMENPATAAGKVLWDLDGKGVNNPWGDPDLGYTIGKPIIARLADTTGNASWYALFGNGYLSANGCPVLFIVHLSDGTIVKIGPQGTPAVSGPSAASTGGTVCTTSNANLSNGLGPVALEPVNGGALAGYAYAGDLQGNLWKFDLTSIPSPGTAVMAGQLLFQASPSSCVPAAGSSAANTCQMITSAPVLGPALPGQSGTMVYFGTGRLFAVGDASSTAPQAFYGILDNGSGKTVASSSLVALTAKDSGSIRTISGGPMSTSNLGWYMNLPDGPSTGGGAERVTFSPILIDGFVLFGTDIPSINSCNAGGSGWFMAVSASSLTLVQPFFMSPTTVTSGGGPASPMVSGVMADSGMPVGMTGLVASGGGGGSQKTDQTSGSSTNPNVTIEKCTTAGCWASQTNLNLIKGRISWHELVR